MTTATEQKLLFGFEFEGDIVLTASQLVDLGKRIAAGAQEIIDHPTIWPGDFEVSLVVSHIGDAFPDGAREDEIRTKCIVLDPERTLWVFFRDYYVDRDGELRFE